MAGGTPEAMWHQIRAGQRGVGDLLTTDPAQLSEDGIQGWREKMERSADMGGLPEGRTRVGLALEKAGGAYEQL